MICYSPPRGSITHAGPLPQRGQHLGIEEQKPGDAAGCVTLPRHWDTWVRRHHWLPVCVPSLRAGASLRWELPGDPLHAHPMFSLWPDSKAQYLQDHPSPSPGDADCPSSPRPHPSLLPPEAHRPSRWGPSASRLPHWGCQEDSRRQLPPKPSLARARPPKDTLGATGCELCAGRSAGGHPKTLLREDGIRRCQEANARGPHAGSDAFSFCGLVNYTHI